MIYTITLNPALDHFLDVEELRVDDANRVTRECLYAGGKGIDVSRAIRHLGGDSMALGFIGGHTGQVMVDLLKAEGVTCYFTPIAQETRRNIIVSTQRARTQTMLNSRGPVVTRVEWDAFLTHLTLLDLRDAYVVVSGSLPVGVPSDAYRRIIEVVQSHGARAVLDADGPCLKAGLRAKPFAIKPNVKELQRLTGKPLRSESDLLRVAGRVQRSGVEVVLVSRGAKGVVLVGPQERYRAVPPVVTVRSTVGAGDSTVAGFVMAHAAGKGLKDCVRLATAAGTAATLAPGNQLCRVKDVRRLLSKITVMSC
ncbi:MAG: 1-phosphofructokinase [Nitrospira sp.]|jgi:6-phosphofructokinase 2|nr:1-phosphofructokinase [Nitrospira sp.]